jgi:hypothetical protein
MATAKDGSKHHSNTRARMHDEKMDEEGKKKAKPADEHEPKGDKEPKAAKPGNHAEPDGDEGMDSQEPIEDVVAQHGPADKMEMNADPASGAMKMTTHHGGMKHHSTHTDPMAMGHHMMKAMGHQPPEQAPPAAAAGMGGDATGMAGGGGIPGMM